MRTSRARTRLSGLLAGVTLVLGPITTLALVPPGPAAAAVRVQATETLNVRSGPGASYEIIGAVRRGGTVTSLSASSGWTRISFGTRAAYVASRYLTRATTAPAAVAAGSVRTTTTAVNVRRGAGTSYPVLAVLPGGRRVTMTGRTSAGFAEVVAGHVRGWASTTYLRSAPGALPASVGTRVATVALDLRTSSGAGSHTVGEVRRGSRLSITGVTAHGRAQIVHGGHARWVTARYLALPGGPGPAAPGLPAVTGSRYATTALDIRTTSADRYQAVTEVPRGTRLNITGVVRNGRMQVIYDGAARWVTARYLSRTRPAARGGGGYAVEKGLKPNAVKVHRAAMARFPQITTYYGVRKDPIPDHPSGRALDLMLPAYRSASGRSLGLQIRTWARAHARELGIQYVIYDQHIWNIQRDRDGWRAMANRGSDSANHKNHVHITVYG